MDRLLFIGIILLSYLIGSIPFGYLIVSVFTGKDIRKIQSGRTGGTNAMRAAGFWAGLSTAIGDLLKGAAGVWIAKSLFPDNAWLHILAALATILGHNYSIFLMERKENGRLHLRGGAGGATMAGGAMALWPPAFLIMIPLSGLLLFGLGYASVTTMSLPLIAAIIFAIRAELGYSPWVYVLYGLLAEIILIWALRPNIKRLINGTERLVGWRANRQNNRSRTSLQNPDPNRLTHINH